MVSRLPPKPDFATLDAGASGAADSRTQLLSLIGNLVVSWSNNESMFIYVLMLLMQSDQISAVIVFATLNTTRARLDLVQRLARAKIRDKSIAEGLEGIVDRFNACTKLRNEFNHAFYSVNNRGEFTHTQSMRIQESRGRIRLGHIEGIDQARMEKIALCIADLTRLNRDIWDFLPRLEAHMSRHAAAEGDG